jgi:thiol-disulfide isomerase/thioredoxin
MSLYRCFLAVSLTVVAICPFSTSAAELSPAPAWQLNNLDGKITKLSDFRGKVVILNFWATWCPPCRMEIPGFIKLQNEYSASGLVVVGVSIDSQGPEVDRAFVTKHGITTQSSWPTKRQSLTMAGLNSSRQPSLLIDKATSSKPTMGCI